MVRDIVTTALDRPDLPQIERGLDMAVTALVFFQIRRPEELLRFVEDKPLEMLTASALMKTDSATLKARDLCENPIEVGLKSTIRQLGKLAFDIVGDDGMLDVAERVCAKDNENWGRRMSAINSAWNGIGHWYS